MNITTEDIITELKKMLPQTDGLYAYKVQGIITKLQSGRYDDLTLLMPSDDLIYELRSIGFHDIAEKLTTKGVRQYGRYNN